ncbi:hypothetical protein ACSNOH_18435 [Streptomyces sp. URMC 127]|uniref:hypothetical protein n=1 Tax=Streptomyces sp. URMC 127 TaxID=3423402 RepID=UPI003F19FFE1
MRLLPGPDADRPGPDDGIVPVPLVVLGGFAGLLEELERLAGQAGKEDNRQAAREAVVYLRAIAVSLAAAGLRPSAVPTGAVLSRTTDRRGPW